MINLWIPTAMAVRILSPNLHVHISLHSSQSLTFSMSKTTLIIIILNHFSQVANAIITFPAAQTWQLRFVSTLPLCWSKSRVADNSDITGQGKSVDVVGPREEEYFITKYFIILQGPNLSLPSRFLLLPLQHSLFWPPYTVKVPGLAIHRILPRISSSHISACQIPFLFFNNSWLVVHH